jgi:hypothetical protein
MSLVPAVLSESSWLREDGAKFFFFGACFVALLVLARFASNRSESSYTPPPIEPEEPRYAPAEALPLTSIDSDAVDEEVEADPASLPRVRSVSFTLSMMQFKSFDIETGPPDHESFCDEVSINLNYRGGVMPWNYTVATPKGIESKIRGSNWKSAFLPQQVMVVPYWDHNMITADLVGRIRMELEAVPEEVAEDEMKEAERIARHTTPPFS